MLIIDNSVSLGALNRGSVIVTQAPVGFRLVIVMVPPCCSTIAFTMASPRPVPLPISLVVKNGSNTFESAVSGMPGPLSDSLIK